MGTCTAVVAWIVDVSEATVSGWKTGHCKSNFFRDRESCCRNLPGGADCSDYFLTWADDYWAKFAIYVAFAVAFGIISCSVTMLTKSSLPATSPGQGDRQHGSTKPPQPAATGKTMYMAAGSGIPEIKTILSGFVIPNFLDFKVLFVKGFGAVFAVATGMCLGKEGPFVHISTCVGYLVAKQFPKYRDNGRKMREMLSAACASGLSVAFGQFFYRSGSYIY
jgi:chloride channel 3/4/5